MRRGPLDLDLGLFTLPRRGAAFIVPLALVIHVVMPVVWPLLPVRPAVVDRIPQAREWAVTRGRWLDECLAEEPQYGCRSAAIGAWTSAVAEMNLVRDAAQLGLAPFLAHMAAAGRVRRAVEVACPPDMPRRERAECRRFELF